jgi:hypothetical protein
MSASSESPTPVPRRLDRNASHEIGGREYRLENGTDDGHLLPRADNLEPRARRRSRVHPESLGLAPGCKPVREIAKKSKRISRPGVFASRKTFDGQAIRTESILEMEGLAHIEVNPRYKRVAPQPHQLIFHHEKPDGSTRVHSYVPDCAVLTDEGRVIVVDFKWAYLRALPEWVALEPIIR